MGQLDQVTAEASAEASAPVGSEEADPEWAESLRDVMRKVIGSLPDEATLGELVHAARSSPAMSPVLGIFTVQELIDTAKKKPKPPPAARDGSSNGHGSPDEIQFDEDGNPILDLDTGPAVIRRRADVPDGDLRVLRSLADRGPQRESDLTSQTNLTTEQLRIIIRHLRTKGYIHIEGSGAKRRLKVTRTGSGFLRKHKR